MTTVVDAVWSRPTACAPWGRHSVSTRQYMAAVARTPDTEAAPLACCATRRTSAKP